MSNRPEYILHTTRNTPPKVLWTKNILNNGFGKRQKVHDKEHNTYTRAFANFFKLFLARWRLAHGFLKTSVAQIQNFRSIEPKITLRRAKNKKQPPNAATRQNLAVLKPSKAEPLQPYVWSDFFQNLDLGYWYL